MALASMSMQTKRDTCFNRKEDIYTLIGGSPKLGDKFAYLGSSVSSIENNINTRLAEAGFAIDRLSIIYGS